MNGMDFMTKLSKELSNLKKLGFDVTEMTISDEIYKKLSTEYKYHHQVLNLKGLHVGTILGIKIKRIMR